MVQMHSARSTWAWLHGAQDLGQLGLQLGEAQMAMGIGEHGQTGLCEAHGSREAGNRESGASWAAARRRAERQMVWVARSEPRVGAENFFNLELQHFGFFVCRETDAHTLRAASGCLGRRDPRHFAGNGVTLGVVGQAQQHVDIVAQSGSHATRE